MCARTMRSYQCVRQDDALVLRVATWDRNSRYDLPTVSSLAPFFLPSCPAASTRNYRAAVCVCAHARVRYSVCACACVIVCA